MIRKFHCGVILAIAPVLGACTVAPEDTVPPVPAAVAALAAPGQDIQSARLDPEDGCYWYRHRGPVETTLLPLRAKSGGRICTGKKA